MQQDALITFTTAISGGVTCYPIRLWYAVRRISLHIWGSVPSKDEHRINWLIYKYYTFQVNLI